MTVDELIELLGDYPPDAKVFMVMDWTELPKEERPSEEQWKDELGGLASAGAKSKLVYLLNKNFK